MTVAEFYKKLNELYSPSLSCSWDNDGLMCSADMSKDVKRVLTTMDVTDACLEYAKANGFDLILSHHPMIFKGLKSVTEGSLNASQVIFCIVNGISVISLHTRLDAGENGVNDCLAQKLGLEEISTFGDEESPTLGRIGTIDPMSSEDFAAMVRDALGCKTVNAYLSNKTITKVAVVGGGASDFAYPALKVGADAFVCGECRYNTALDAADSGLTVIEAGHYASEFPVCKRLAELAQTIAKAETEIYEIKTFKQI